jgi:hypothetical protein
MGELWTRFDFDWFYNRSFLNMARGIMTLKKQYRSAKCMKWWSMLTAVETPCITHFRIDVMKEAD